RLRVLLRGNLGASAGSVSGSQSATAAPQAALNSVSETKIDCQPRAFISRPPASGARIGASPITNIIWENTLAACTGSQLSRTTARVTTIPAQPPSACAKRAATNQSSVGASAQARDARVKSVTPISNGQRRP